MARNKQPKHPDATPRAVARERCEEAAMALRYMAMTSQWGERSRTEPEPITIPAEHVPSQEALLYAIKVLESFAGPKKRPRLKQLPPNAGKYDKACLLITELAASGEAKTLHDACVKAADRLNLADHRQLETEWKARFGKYRPLFGGLPRDPAK